MPNKNKKVVKIGNIELDIVRGGAKDYIPQSGAEIWYPEEQAQALAVAVRDNIPAILIGETGTGKTSVLKDIAYKRKQPYVRVNMHGYTSPDELIGSKSAQGGSTYFEKGVVVKAMEMGALLVVDELNAATPDTMFIFHALLDDEKKITLPNGEVVKPHKNFRFFATMNPGYEGTRSVNRAFLDRFGIILNIEPMSRDLELKYLIGQGIDRDVAESMTIFAGMIRRAYSENKVTNFVSTRSLLQWGHLVNAGFSVESAFNATVLGRCHSDERSALADVYSASVKRNLNLIEKKDRLVVVEESAVKKQNEKLKELEREISDLRIEKAQLDAVREQLKQRGS